MGTDLCGMSIAQLARLLRRGRVSPVEVAQAYLERARRVQPRLNAYITLTEDLALEQARSAEQEIARGRYRGPLHGIPFALKDLYATAGVRTTAGALALRDWVPQEDCALWARLRSAGAVLLGKLNLHEWAYGTTNQNPHYGPCRNPWDPERVPGGSSGGSGSALAVGACAGSLGSDTGGSIRIPASFCGVVGLKPTYGRCSRRGAVPLSWSLDHTGPMARTVEDCALILQAIAGHDPQDPGSAPVPVPSYRRFLRRGVRGLRIGRLTGDYFRGVDPEVDRAVTDALRTLEGLGAVVEEVSLPEAEVANAVNYIILSSEASAYHLGRLREDPSQFGADVRERLVMGALLPATAYVRARRARLGVRRAFLRLLERVDLLALPTTPIPAHRLDEEAVEVGGRRMDVRSWATRFTAMFNLTGLPALSVPCGRTAQGLPVGLQLVGRPFEEGILLQAGHAYEQARGPFPLAPLPA